MCSLFSWGLLSFVVQLLSCVHLFATSWTAAHQASLPFTISQSLLKLMSIKLVVPSNHLILCHPLLLPSIFPSIRVFSSKLVLCIRWPKFWSFSFSISPSSAYSDTQNYSLLLARTLLWNSSPSLVAFKNGRAGFTKGQTSVQISVLLGNIWQQTFLSLFWSLIPVGREVLPKLEISALWKGRHNWDTEECTGKRKAQSNAPCSWLLVSNAMKGKRSGTKKNSSGTCVAVGRKLFLFTSCLSSLRMQVFILLFNSHGDPKGQKFLSQSRRGLESLKLSS